MSRLHRARRRARYASLSIGLIVPPIVNITFAASRPDRYFFAAQGMRGLNKEGSLGAGYSTYASRLAFRSAPWVIPAGTRLIFGYPNWENVEGNFDVNEKLFGASTAADGLPGVNDVTLEGAVATYSDAGGVTRIVPSTALTNGGVLSATVRNGGVLAITDPIAYAMPASSKFFVTTCLSGPDNMTLGSGYKLASGEVARKGTSSFLAAAQANGSLSTGGSTGAGINGYQYGPFFMAAMGADGRIVPLMYGDSLFYPKNGDIQHVVPDRVMGFMELALARSTGSYATAWCNGGIAGSGLIHYDKSGPQASYGSGAYNPDIQKGKRELIAQVTALNAALGSGRPYPFTDIVTDHGRNNPQNSAAAQEALIGTLIGQFNTDWPGVPVSVCTMMPAGSTTDGGRTLAGQVINVSDRVGGAMLTYNDNLLANKLGGKVQYAIDTATAMSPDRGANRDKWKIHPYEAALTRATTSALELYVDRLTSNGATLAVGSCVVIDPLGGNAQAFTIETIDTVTAGSEYRLGLTVGGSAGTMPVGKAIGVTIAGIYSSDGDTDGNPGIGTVHHSYELDQMIAAWQGANSLDAWKLAAAATAGFVLSVAPAPTSTVTISAAISQNEGNSGTTAYVYTVTRSSATGAVAIPWAFAAGTTDASDFVGGLPAGGTLNLADGVASGTITINVQGDTAIESNESFTVSITPPSGYAAGTATSATGTIVNEDVAGGYETESQTLFAAMTTAPSTARKAAIDNRIKALKTAGVWALRDTDFVVAAADAQAAGLDWKNPSRSLSVVGTGLTFTPDRGYTGANTTTDYLDLLYNPSGNSGANSLGMGINNAHASVYALTNGTSTSAAFTDASSRMSVKNRSGTQAAFKLNSATTTALTDSVAVPCCVTVTRGDASNQLAYRDSNQTPVVTAAAASTNLPGNLTILKSSDQQIASFGVGQNLTAAQVAALADANKAYLQAVNAIPQ